MPSVQYVIDIATAMPEGESTIAELDKLTANLMGSGKGAEHFQQAIKQVSSALDAAKAASVAANAALAAGAEEYKVLERAALQTAKAAEKAAKSGTLDPTMSRDAAKAAAAVDAYAVALKKLEGEAASAAKKEDALSTALGNVKKLSGHVDKSLEEQDRSLKKLKSGLSGLGGPLGSVGAKGADLVDGFHDLTESLGATNAAAVAGAVGVAAIGAAVVAVSAIVLAATVAVAGWAIGLADANREYGLTLEATEVLNPALEKLHGTIDELGNQTGLTEQAIDGIATSLQEAHVAAADMPAALRAASLAEAALGTGGAAQFIQRMQASGKSVRQFSDTISTQLGGVVAKKLLGLTAQAGQFKQNIGTLFGGLNIDPALTGLQKLVALFDENTAAGSAIKFLFESVFQPLINQAENASTVIEAFVLGFLIGMTKLYIAIKPAIKAVSEFFGMHDPSLTDTLAAVTKAAEYLAPVIALMAAVFVAGAVAVGATVAVFLALQVAVYAVVAALIYVGAVIVSSVYDAFMKVSNYLQSIDLSTIGMNILQGLANGITGAASFVVDAVSNAVKGAIKSAKSALGIASPSKVFAEIGVFTGEGMAMGLDDSAEQVQSSMADMVAPPDVSSLSAQDSLSGNAGGSAKASGQAPKSSDDSKSGGIHIDLSGAHLEFNGVKDGPTALEEFKAMLTRCYEEDAASAGGASAEDEAA